MCAGVVAVSIATLAPSSAVAHAVRGAAAAAPATMAYSFPQECTVLPVEKRPFTKARALLAELGCRVRRTEQASSLRKGLVIVVVGGERTYAFGHTVTLIVSGGPAT
jgi:beta-lactam-binding protein with PASTA domain